MILASGARGPGLNSRSCPVLEVQKGTQVQELAPLRAGKVMGGEHRVLATGICLRCRGKKYSRGSGLCEDESYV